jgi:hypothetical protein
MEVIRTELYPEKTAPRPVDFEGKTISRFEMVKAHECRFFFTDGTAFAVRSGMKDGQLVMRIVERCAWKECEEAVAAWA